jgi:hypothetical protein
MEMDTGQAPNALCAYECTARAAGIAMKKNQEARTSVGSGKIGSHDFFSRSFSHNILMLIYNPCYP